MPVNICTRDINGERVLQELLTPNDINEQFILVDQSFLGSYSVSGDSNQPNNILTLTPNREDSNISTQSNIVTYTGSPDKIMIDAMTYFREGQNSTFARIAPELELVKNGTIVVAKSGTGYQRHSSNHVASSNTISWTDHNPGTNPTYALRAQQGASQTDVLNVDLGHFSINIIEKVSILQNI